MLDDSTHQVGKLHENKFAKRASQPEDEPALRDREAEEGSPSDEAKDDTTDGDQASSGKNRLKWVLDILKHNPVAVTFGLIVAALAALGGYFYWDYARHFESTDDAFVDSRQFSVAPKVSGYLTAVAVTDNQHINVGDLVARIDERDYRIALEQADAQVTAAEANIQNIDAQITAQQAEISEAQAQIVQAQAVLTFAEQEAVRYEDLAHRGAGSVQQAQQSSSNLRQQRANLERTQAAATAAQRQIDPLKAQRRSAEASLAQAEAQRDQARLNLSYTTVTAAQAGRIVRLTAAVGQLAQAGTSLTMFVPDEIWVTANFKETQLALMRPGQPVAMTIDAYPTRTIRGRVDSIQPGSGTAFSLLPAENATGNYVKIVQRVPVKLTMDDPPRDVSIGPGMSVVPTVRVLPRTSLFERLTRRE